MTRFVIIYYDIHGTISWRHLDAINGNPVDAAAHVFDDIDIAPSDTNYMCPVVAYPIYAN